MLRSLAIAGLTLALLVPPALAQAPGQGGSARQDARGDTRPRPEPRAEGRKLPADVTTEHVVELPGGRSLKFTATAGALTLTDPDGAVQAELAYVAYRREGGDPAARPVTFAVNGGPGSANAYLQLLAVGPWRLPLDGRTVSPSAPPTLVPNDATWLDFTDLVFIDPVGTGYSRANGSREEIRDRFYTIDGDVSSIGAAIARWLRQNDRLASPKFFLGESYGGFRGPLLAHKLQTELGVGLSGLVLLSPVLDFGYLSQPRHAPLEDVARLPSFAAAARERSGPVTRADLADAESYAGGEYLVDLMRGVRDREALDRITRRVAALTGLDPAFVARKEGRIDASAFIRERDRSGGTVVSLYDTGVEAFVPDPISDRDGGADALLTALQAPLTSAMVEFLSRELNWRVPNARYELSSGSVGRDWRYGRGRRAPEAVDDLRSALALDRNLRVLVAHGLTDLVTPYFASELILRQLPSYGSEPRATLSTYPGGHMFYTRDASRRAFAADAKALIEAAVAARTRD